MTEAAADNRKLHHLGELYLWLSLAFSPPEEALLSEEFTEPGLTHGRFFFPEEELTLLRLLRDEDTRADSFLELQREHARLFIGPPKALVRPYESCYFGDDLLMTEQTVSVRSCYEEAGVYFDGWASHEAPDHISVELNFLAMVCSGETNCSPGECEEREQQFIGNHLGRWAGIFAEKVLDGTESSFYRAASDLLLRLVRLRSP